MAYLYLAISLLEDVGRAGIPLTPETAAYCPAALRNAMVYQYGLMNYDATIELGIRYSEINPEAEGEYAFHVLMGNSYAFLNTISVAHGQLREPGGACSANEAIHGIAPVRIDQKPPATEGDAGP